MILEEYLEQIEEYAQNKKKKKIKQVGNNIISELKKVEDIDQTKEIVKKLEGFCLPSEVYSIPALGHQQLGNMYLIQKRHDKAEDSFLLAEEIIPKEDKTPLKKEILGNLSTLLVTKTDHENDIAFYKDNLERLSKAKDSPEKDREIINTYIQYGEVLMSGGKPGEAIDILKKAKSLLEENFNPRNYCKMLIYLGQSMYLANKDSEEAVEYLYDAMTLATHEVLPHRIVHSMYIKGILHLKMSQDFEAMFNLRTSQGIGKQLSIRQFDSEIASSLKQAEMGFKVSPNLDESVAKELVTKQAESDLRVAKKYMSIEEWKKSYELLTKCIGDFNQLDDLDKLVEITDLIEITQNKGGL